MCRHVLKLPGVVAAGMLACLLGGFSVFAESAATQDSGAKTGGSTAASQPAAAQISGTLKTADTVKRIVAVDRDFADVLKTSEANPKEPFLYEGAFDAKTGAFVIPKLLPGRTYDLIVWTENAAHEEVRWEGVNMDYHRVILPADAVTAEDKKWLEDFVKDMPSFYDKSRILHMAADHKHATLLVELARTKDFHSGKNGEVIYRVELWYFENLFGGWAKDKNTEKVMVRVRAAGDKLWKYWQFLPELGGIEPNAAGKPVAITLPEKPSEKNGLAGKVP